MATPKPANAYEPEYAVPPGETLSEMIQELGMNQCELATRLGLSTKHVNQIIKGKAPITQETAIGLERVTGVPARFWNNREMLYQERLARIEAAKRLPSDLQWLKTIPTKELIGRGVIAKQPDNSSLLQATLAFFGVSSVKAWREFWCGPKVAARRSRCFKSHPAPTATWLRLGELTARKVTCQPYSKVKFSEAITEARTLTTEPADVFTSKMRRICATAGVAVVFAKEIPKAPWYGASWWLTPNKAIIELSLRGKSDDQFWFSFFHEAGHILLDSKKDVFINDGSEDDPRELRANQFSKNFLIPADRALEIPRLRSAAQVRAFAESIGIAPGVVVGQFQRETGRWRCYNNLKRKLVWHES